MHPVRFNVDGSVTLLQEDDVGHHLRTGVGLERIVGQTDRTQQFRPLRDVFASDLTERLRGLQQPVSPEDDAKILEEERNMNSIKEGIKEEHKNEGTD